MGNMAVICSDEELNRKVRDINENMPIPFSQAFLKTKTAAIQYLNYELPQINLIHWDDEKLPTGEIIQEIQKDPWLHYAATIFILGSSNEQDTLKKIQGTNLVAIIPKDKLVYFLPRVLKTLYDNQELLSQWNFHSLVKSSISGQFHLRRDAFDIITHTSLLGNFMYNSNLIDNNDKERFNVFMLEHLMKAVSFAQAGEESRITMIYQIHEAQSFFRLSLGSAQFNWKEQIPEEKTFGPLKTEFALDGRELLITIAHQKNLAAVLPSFFEKQTILECKEGDIVFDQGEESDHLYFIVSGKYEVSIGSKRISVLDPSNVFMGEMSFLLKNRRTATVRSLGQGKLIKISKQEFIDSLKTKPHYGFFLSRMLAERIVELHQMPS